MPFTKAIFRKKCLRKIKKSAKHNKIYKNKLVEKKLLKLLYSSKKQNILVYYPLEFEVNIVNLLQKLRKKHNLFLPFMQGESFKMVPFRLPLKKKKFNIFEAGNSLRNIRKIDIAIVPVIGVDGGFQRVGFGKGMYDRFYETLQKKPLTFFVQLEFCWTKEHICDTYDIYGDILVTPFKVLKNKKIIRK